MEELIKLYDSNRFAIEQFMKRLVNFFQDDPVLHSNELPCVHSVKYRLKSKEHLIEKIDRKRKEGRIITEDTFFDSVTDLAGIRVLHLYLGQAERIHNEIVNEAEKGEWVLFEKPKAYTWDLDAKAFYENLGITTEVKPSYYTSIHYVLMPKKSSHIKCEIQVRTLWEEAWGELEHLVKYKNQENDMVCDDQLKVLAQIVGAGVKLSDAIIKNKFQSSFL